MKHPYLTNPTGAKADNLAEVEIYSFDNKEYSARGQERGKNNAKVANRLVHPQTVARDKNGAK